MPRLPALKDPPLLGAHCSVAGGPALAIERAHAISCASVQIFGTNPRQWQARRYTSEEIRTWKIARQAHAVGPVFSHGIYLVNLGSSDDHIWSASVRALVEGSAICHNLRLDGLIFHLGSYGDDSKAHVLPRVAKAVRMVLDHTSRTVPLVLENSAGSGKLIGSKLEDIAAVIAGAGGGARLRLCVDSAHAFASGYDVRTRAGLDALVESISATVGLERLTALHLNDSAVPLGSNRDRHANLGQGEIGLAGLATFVRHPAFAGLPMLMEVPGFDHDGPDKPNIEIARALAGLGRLTPAGALRKAEREAPASRGDGGSDQ